MNAIVPHCHEVNKGLYQKGNNEVGLSAGLAQTSQRDAYCHRFAQNLKQHHGPALTISHLVDAFDAGEHPFGQAPSFIGIEQSIRLRLNRRFLHP